MRYGSGVWESIRSERLTMRLSQPNKLSPDECAEEGGGHTTRWNNSIGQNRAAQWGSEISGRQNRLSSVEGAEVSRARPGSRRTHSAR